jgi:phenylacetate-CoA ligase
MASSDLDRIRFAKLNRQVRRAWEQTDFYREKFSAVGFDPTDFRSLADLQKLPIVGRQELRAAGHRAYSRDVSLEGCTWVETSGSTGSPMHLPLTRRDKTHRVLKDIRALMVNGYHPRDTMIILADPDDTPKRKALIQRLGFLRRDYKSIFADVDEQAAKLREFQPDVIYSYASCLRILAERLREDGHVVPKPKMVVSAGEVLDFATRRLITETFEVEPTDFYGAMEFGWIAWQCPERNAYHINTDCLIVECLSDGQPVAPGKEGELVITSLHSDAAPLIRYATGDVGRLSASRCKCGRSLPMLASVSGRIADCIVLPGGRTFSPYFVTCALKHVPGVSQFQVIQEGPTNIRVRLIPVDQRLPDQTVSRAIRGALSSDVSVVVEHTDVLRPEPNGKFRVVKSLLPGTRGNVEAA